MGFHVGKSYLSIAVKNKVLAFILKQNVSLAMITVILLVQQRSQSFTKGNLCPTFRQIVEGKIVLSAFAAS